MTPTSRAVLLEKFVLEHEGMTFDWAHRNCGHLIEDWANMVEGLGATVPPTRSQADTLRMIEARGGMEALVTEQLKRPSMLPTLAQIGDVVLFENATLGICNGRLSVCVSASEGTVYKATESALAAWPMGREPK